MRRSRLLLRWSRTNECQGSKRVSGEYVAVNMSCWFRVKYVLRQGVSEKLGRKCALSVNGSSADAVGRAFGVQGSSHP